MRTDVKLGVVIALATVLVAGGYYMDGDETPIEMTKESLAEATKPAVGQKSSGRSAVAPAKAKAVAKPRNARGTQGKASPGKARRGTTAQGKRAATPPVSNQSKRAKARASRQNRNRAGQSGVAKTPKPQPAATSKAAPPVSTRRPTTTTTGRPQAGASGHPSARTLAKKVPASTPTGRSSNRSGAAAAREAKAKKPAAKKSGMPAGVRSTDASKRRNPPGRSAGAANRSNARDAARGGLLARKGRAPAKRSNPATGAKRVDHRSVAVDVHRVQPGDSLAALAKMYYGHEKHVPFLISSNPKIVDPRRLALGTVVRIPPLPTSEPANKPTSAPVIKASTRAGKASVSARSYTVKAGDTFYGIAGSQLGDSARWRSLYELNAKLVGDDPSRLRIGQVLKLPPK